MSASGPCPIQTICCPPYTDALHKQELSIRHVHIIIILAAVTRAQLAPTVLTRNAHPGHLSRRAVGRGYVPESQGILHLDIEHTGYPAAPAVVHRLRVRLGTACRTAPRRSDRVSKVQPERARVRRAFEHCEILSPSAPCPLSICAFIQLKPHGDASEVPREVETPGAGL